MRDIFYRLDIIDFISSLSNTASYLKHVKLYGNVMRVYPFHKRLHEFQMAFHDDSRCHKTDYVLIDSASSRSMH